MPQSSQAALPGKRHLLRMAMREARFADAAAILAGLPPRMAVQDWAVRAKMMLAEQDPGAEPPPAAATGDVAGAVSRAAVLTKLGRAAEAAPIIAAALAANPRNPKVLRQAAIVAEQTGDLDRALALWADLRAQAPESNAGYVGALLALRRARRLELAPAIIEAGLARFPNDANLVVWAAEMADQAKNAAQADPLWQRAVALRPEDPGIALSAAMCLMGVHAGRRKRMGELLRRLDAHHVAFPDYAAAYTAHVLALRETGALEEADRLAAGWRGRFPADPGLGLAHAGVLEEQRRLGDALHVITELRAAAPATAALEAAYVRALSCTGQHEAAEAACLAACAQFPKQRHLLSEFARIATRRGDWQMALDRLLDAQRELPNDIVLAKEAQNIRLQLAEPQDAAPAKTGDPFAQFESLGGTSGGCEFGIVQRRLGSDAVGLLRWTRIEPPELLAALNCDFEGVGDPENTVLAPRRISVEQEEWGTGDKRFVMETHTFVRVSDAPEDKMFQQSCRRIRFLRGKLLQDLAAGEKIYVYKALQPIEDEVILAIHTALARYGTNALLCVMRAGRAHRRASVRELRPGAYAGYVGHFMKDETGNPGFDIGAWKAICLEAAATWSTAREQAASRQQAGPQTSRAA